MNKLTLIASIGFAAALATADISLAKNGNNGGGNGGGNSSASSNNGGGNAARSNRNSSSSANTTRIIRVKPVPPGQQRHNTVKAIEAIAPEIKRVHGNSALGALNAAHASEQAFANASPNSRVGKIGAYRDQVLTSTDIAEGLEIQQEILDSLTEPERTSDEVGSDLEVANDYVTAVEDELEDLAQQLADAGGSDPDIEAQIEETIADLQAANGDVEELEQEAMAIDAYDDAVEKVAELEDAALTSAESEDALLEAAANKPVTPEVEADLREILGLPPMDIEDLLSILDN